MTNDTRNANAVNSKGDTLDIHDEFRLMLLCARTRVDQRQQEQIRALTQKQLDWEFILTRAQPYAPIPLLYRNLSKYSSDLVPSPTLKQLESDNKINTERNRKNTAEMIRVLREFNAANIRVVSYKWPGLAVLAHGDIELRLPDRLLFPSKVRKRLRVKLTVYRQLAKFVFTMILIPNSDDRKVINLPGAARPLYYLVQPACLARELRFQNTSCSDSIH
jgi:hypothetical protein